MRPIRWLDRPIYWLLIAMTAGFAACGKDKPLIKGVNHPPQITAFTARPDTVEAGATSLLKVTATDFENDTLRYSFSAAVGRFSHGAALRDTIRWQAPDSSQSVRVTATVSDGEASVEETVDLWVEVPPADLAGIVRKSGTGEPLDGVLIAVGGASTTTSGGGLYTLTVPAGRVRLTASKSGYETFEAEFTALANRLTNFNISLVPILPHTQLSGTVTNSLGQPLVGASCKLDSIEVLAGAGGHYSFAPLNVGDYDFLASFAGYSSHAEVLHLDQPAETLDVVLDATPLAAPRQLHVQKGENFSMTVSWDPPEVTATLTGYRLYKREDAGSFTPVQTEPLSPSTLSMQVAGAENHRYTFMITAINVENEEGNFSDPSNVVVLTSLSELVPILSDNVIMGNTPTGWGTETHAGNPVFVGTFRMEATEVSNLQYLAFLYEAVSSAAIQVNDSVAVGDAHPLLFFSGSKIRHQGSDFTIVSGYEDHPVVGVTWYGAQAYAQSIGRRLPTEAEWEKTARGVTLEIGNDGHGNGYGFEYPWGMTPPNTNRANYGSNFGSTRPVRSFASGATTQWSAPIYNLAGNVWEWCDDWFGSYHNPHRPPDSGTVKVLRGGGWREAESYLRVGARFSVAPETASSTVGFRCAAAP